MRVVVKEDLDSLPFLHLVGLLPFVKEDIILRISCTSVQKGTKAGDTDDRELCDGVFLIYTFLFGRNPGLFHFISPFLPRRGILLPALLSRGYRNHNGVFLHR